MAARLEIIPSEGVKDLVSELYRPSVRDTQLARLALRSQIAVPLELYPGNVYFYDDGTGHNGIQDYMRFNSRTLPRVAGHQLPMLSRLRVLRDNNSGAMRLQTAFGVEAVDQSHFQELREFRSVADTGILYANLDIPPGHVVPNEVVVRTALRGIASSLGVNHPAHGSVPLARRVVDNQTYYGKIGRGLVART